MAANHFPWQPPIYHGNYPFSMATNHFPWQLPIYHGNYPFTIEATHLLWFLLIYHDTHSCTMEFTFLLCCLPVYYGSFPFTMASTLSLWHPLVYLPMRTNDIPCLNGEIQANWYMSSSDCPFPSHSIPLIFVTILGPRYKLKLFGTAMWFTVTVPICSHLFPHTEHLKL